MNRTETKNWAKEKIKGHIWELLIPIIVAGFLTNLSFTFGGNGENSTRYTITLGIFFYFVEVGLIKFIKAFNEDKAHEFKDLFSYTGDYVRIFLTDLLQGIFVFLFLLLLIVPGIIKALAYALVPFILEDEKYKDKSSMEILKLSQEMMNGHKKDYFVFGLSYFGWFFLTAITCGLAGIYVAPYFTVAQVKFLSDIKEDYEKNNK